MVTASLKPPTKPPTGAEAADGAIAELTIDRGQGRARAAAAAAAAAEASYKSLGEALV